MASLGKAANAGPKAVTGVVVTVFLIFLFFGDRFGASSTGSHSPLYAEHIELRLVSQSLGRRHDVAFADRPRTERVLQEICSIIGFSRW